jgi:hypothetical protein
LRSGAGGFFEALVPAGGESSGKLCTDIVLILADERVTRFLGSFLGTGSETLRFGGMLKMN